MAKENIEKFKEAVYADQALKEKLNNALAECEPEKQAETLSSLAQEAGFAFTAEEYREYLMQGQELDDEELDAVSGGADRDWRFDGCSATVEAGSWCWKDDWCAIWDTTYDHGPVSYKCPECGGQMYSEDPNHYLCIVCGKRVTHALL